MAYEILLWKKENVWKDNKNYDYTMKNYEKDVHHSLQKTETKRYLVFKLLHLMIRAISSDHELNVFFINPRIRFAFEAAELTCSWNSEASLHWRNYKSFLRNLKKNGAGTESNGKCTVFLSEK